MCRSSTKHVLDMSGTRCQVSMTSSVYVLYSSSCNPGDTSSLRLQPDPYHTHFPAEINRYQVKYMISHAWPRIELGTYRVNVSTAVYLVRMPLLLLLASTSCDQEGDYCSTRDIMHQV